MNLAAQDGSKTVQHLLWRNRVVEVPAGTWFSASHDAIECMVTRLAASCAAPPLRSEKVIARVLQPGSADAVHAGEWPLHILLESGVRGVELELPIHLKKGESLYLDGYVMSYTVVSIECVNEGPPVHIAADDVKAQVEHLPPQNRPATESEMSESAERVLKIVKTQEEG